MSGRLYPFAAAQLIDETLDWEGGTIKALLLAEGYVFSTSHVVREDINDNFVIATSEALIDPSISDDGVYTGAGAFRWLQLLDPKTVYQVVIFDDTGDDAYSPLIAHWDSDGLIGAPLQLQGEDYFLYAVSPPGGFFQIASGDLLGPLATYQLAGAYALGEIQGSTSYLIPDLVLGRRLVVSDRICIPSSGLNSWCGDPVIKGTPCA